MPTSVIGKVARIYPHTNGNTYLVLRDPKPNVQPRENTWVIAEDEKNYKSIYSLVLWAAANDVQIRFRVDGDDIPTTEHAKLAYVMVDL